MNVHAEPAAASTAAPRRRRRLALRRKTDVFISEVAAERQQGQRRPGA